MAKDGLQRALAQKVPEPVAAPPQTTQVDAPRTPKADLRTVTSLRIDPELLIELKVMAAHEQMRVNEVILDAIKDRLELWKRRRHQREAV